MKRESEWKHPYLAGVVTLSRDPPWNYHSYYKAKRPALCRSVGSVEGGIMDFLSPIVFAMAVISLVGLVAAGFVIRREVRMRWRRAPARRAERTRTDPLNECGGRVVYRRRRLNKWDYIRTP